MNKILFTMAEMVKITVFVPRNISAEFSCTFMKKFRQGTDFDLIKIDPTWQNKETVRFTILITEAIEMSVRLWIPTFAKEHGVDQEEAQAGELLEMLAMA